MKRDMDLIRKLLLRIEAGERSFAPRPAAASGPETTEQSWDAFEAAEEILQEHLRLLSERGFIDSVVYLDGQVLVERLTWDGHDFLDVIRDEEIWSRTKSGALAAGGWTVDILKDLAKGFIIKQIEDKTGIKL